MLLVVVEAAVVVVAAVDGLDRRRRMGGDRTGRYGMAAADARAIRELMLLDVHVIAEKRKRKKETHVSCEARLCARVRTDALCRPLVMN